MLVRGLSVRTHGGWQAAPVLVGEVATGTDAVPTWTEHRRRWTDPSPDLAVTAFIGKAPIGTDALSARPYSALVANRLVPVVIVDTLSVDTVFGARELFEFAPQR